MTTTLHDKFALSEHLITRQLVAYIHDYRPEVGDKADVSLKDCSCVPLEIELTDMTWALWYARRGLALYELTEVRH